MAAVETEWIELGRTWQRQTSTVAWLYGKVTANIIEETSTSITVRTGGAFMYGGYENYVPYHVGIRQVFEDGTTNTVYEDKIIQETTQAQLNQEIWFSSSTFTFEKTTQKFALLPFIKIGCIEYNDANYIAGNDWMFGSNKGILVGLEWTAASCLKGDMNHTSPLNGRNRTLPAYIIFGGKNSVGTGYDNALIIVDSIGGPVTVYDSSNAPHKSKNIYVYDTSGTPRRASKITVYGADGTPHTMIC